MPIVGNFQNTAFIHANDRDKLGVVYWHVIFLCINIGLILKSTLWYRDLGAMNIAMIVIVYVAAVILLLKPWSRSSFKSRSKKYPINHPYRAVSLACDSESCGEVALMGARRFLLDETPDLPLSQCSAKRCACRYVHHEDRRNGIDRRAMSKRSEEGEVPERRGLRGRRKSDWSQLAFPV